MRVYGEINGKINDEIKDTQWQVKAPARNFRTGGGKIRSGAESEPDGGRAPGEAGTEGDQKHNVALLGPAGFHGFIQRNGNGCA